MLQIPAYAENLIYKSVDGLDLKLDIYLSADQNVGVRPAIIFLHGGSWVYGDKKSVQNYYREHVLTELLKAGFVVFSIEYRLLKSENVHFPAPFSDCKDAVRWVKMHAENYAVDTNNIGLWGASAGAHIAMMAAYSPSDFFSGDQSLSAFSPDVSYVINDYGPSNLETLFRPGLNKAIAYGYRFYQKERYEKRREVLLAMTGLDIEKQRGEIVLACRSFSPVQYVQDESVPMLLLHGSSDTTVPLSQAQELDSLLTTHQVPHQFLIYEGLNHGFKNASLEESKLIAKDILAFVKSQK